MAPQKTPRSISIPAFPSRDRVSGIMMLRPMMEDRPGMAPTRIPIRVPKKTTPM